MFCVEFPWIVKAHVFFAGSSQSSYKWGMYLKTERAISPSNTVATHQVSNSSFHFTINFLLQRFFQSYFQKLYKIVSRQNSFEIPARHFTMNTIGYLCCLLGLISIIATIDAINLRNDQNQRLYDSIVTGDPTKMKRPFCNAFTGCGKKRSFTLENSIENPEQTSDKIRIPLPIYRAILRAARREILQNAEQESNGEIYNFDEYLDPNGKPSSHERLLS